MAVLAPAAVRCRSEINLRWPTGDNSSDGWIGDTTHAESGRPENGGSDHNPNYRNIVDALDIDVDGIDCPLLVQLLIRHPSTHYVIWNRTIWSRDYGFRARAYNGSNPHTDHIHLSLIQSVAAENNTTPWGIYSGTATPVVLPTTGGATELSWAQRLTAALPILEKSTVVRGSARKAQALINLHTGAKLDADGIYGALTIAAVKTFQTNNDLTADGIIGPKTWTKLVGSMPTIERDSTGTPTKTAQALLGAFGLPLAIDGAFGPRTEMAVEVFQRRYGLTQDGVVGPITWTALLTR